MNKNLLACLAALIASLTLGCNEESNDSAAKVAELERKANEAIQKQKELKFHNYELVKVLLYN